MIKLKKNITKVFVFADVEKAYDHVNLNILNDAMHDLCDSPFVLQEWADEMRDLTQLNMMIGDIEIKRTNGLPQGSELAPGLFNIYTTYILKKTKNLLDDSIDVMIFADNWIFSFDLTKKDRSLLEIRNWLFAYNAELINTYKMNFTWDEIMYVPFSKLEMETKEDIQIHEFKFLGVKWRFTNAGKLWIDQESVKFNFKNCVTAPGYTVIEFAKRFIVSKYRYYLEYLSIFIDVSNYQKWFKNKLKLWLSKRLICYKISNELLDNIITPKDKKHHFKMFFTPNFAKYNNTTTVFLHNKQILLNKLHELAKLMLEKRFKAGIYQIAHSLFQNRNMREYFKHNPICKRQKESDRVWMILDLIYFGIMAEHRFSTLIAKEQLQYGLRTMRKTGFTVLPTL